MEKTETKDLNYYKNNCEEDYIKTPISVLRYISELEAAINYTHSCTELRDKETPKIEDWLKDNFKRLGRHSFTNTHEDTVWLRSELVEVYNQLHP